MEVKPLVCPRCGADLSPSNERNAYHCMQCGLNVVLDFTSTEGMSEDERAVRLERDVARAQRDKARFERDTERARRDRAQAERDKAAAPYEAEVQKKRLENEKERDRNALKAMIVSFGVLVLILLFTQLQTSIPEIQASFSGKIKVPAAASDLESIAYADAEQRFRDAGFTNIECLELNDIDFLKSFYTDEGSVDYITVNGEDNFGSSSYYPPDATIRIYYHSQSD